MIKLKEIVFLTTAFVFFTTNSEASRGAIYKDCRLMQHNYSNGNLLLHTQKEQGTAIYLVQNRMNYPLLLNHPQHPFHGMNAGWASRLNPKNWSAIQVSRLNFELDCALMQNANHLQKMPCRQVLNVRRYYNPTLFTEPGTYWLRENLAFDKLFQGIPQSR